MKIESVVRLPEGAIRFSGELGDDEAKLVVELGLNYLIRAGYFPAITEALEQANKAEEAEMGYSDEESSSEYEFPTDMEKND